MWMAWGPELTFFCNDAYRRDTLGKKYPWALGRPAREVWAEIWPDIGPRIETVLQTGEATWDEALLLFLERSGVPEETYHTFSYSPLAGDDGRIEGMLCVVSEDTERVIGERRLATLRDLGAAISGARTEAEVLAAAARARSGSDPRSLPFTLIYLYDEDGPRLAAPAASRRSAPPTTAWPRGRARDPRRRDRRARAPPTGAWDGRRRRRSSLPLGAASSGFLVAGLNRYRPLDEGYRGFVEPRRRPDRRRPRPTRAPTRRSAGAPRRCSSSTRPRPRSSPTSATSCGRR